MPASSGCSASPRRWPAIFPRAAPCTSIRWWRCAMSNIAPAVISLFGGLLFAKEVSAGEVLEDVVERRFPLDPSGSFSLRTIDGTVEIFGTDSQEVKIVAVKKAFSPERLNAI